MFAPKSSDSLWKNISKAAGTNRYPKRSIFEKDNLYIVASKCVGIDRTMSVPNILQLHQPQLLPKEKQLQQEQHIHDFSKKNLTLSRESRFHLSGNVASAEYEKSDNLENDAQHWHEYLQKLEKTRRLDFAMRLKQAYVFLESLQQLQQNSLDETQTAYRLAASLSLAHEELSSTLIINDMNKKSPLTTCDDDKRCSQVTSLTNRRLSSNAPPILEVIVPENDHIVSSFLERQHFHVQDNASRIASRQHFTSKCLEKMKDPFIAKFNELCSRATGILQQFDKTEAVVQQAWDTYDIYASNVFRKIQGTRKHMTSRSTSNKASVNTDVANDKCSVGNIWLLELKYRSSVVQQMLEWALDYDKLQCLFTLMKDHEIQRRVKLRKYLNSILRQQLSIFTTTHLDNTSEVITYRNLSDDDDEDSCDEGVVGSDLFNDSSHWNEVNEDVESELNEIMKYLDNEIKPLSPSFMLEKKIELRQQKEQELLQMKNQQKKIPSDSNLQTINDDCNEKLSSENDCETGSDDNSIYSSVVIRDNKSDFTIDDTVEDDNDPTESSDSKDLSHPKDHSPFHLNETVQQRIQRVAEKCGVTTFWESDVTNLSASTFGRSSLDAIDLGTGLDTNNMTRLTGNNSLNTSIDAAALDKTVTRIEEEKQNQIEVQNNRQSSRKSHPEARSTEESVDLTSRLLYSGELLESHHVQFATVVSMILEENDGSGLVNTMRSSGVKTNLDTAIDKGSNHRYIIDRKPPMLCLAVVTSDEILHFFLMPDNSLDQQQKQQACDSSQQQCSKEFDCGHQTSPSDSGTKQIVPSVINDQLKLGHCTTEQALRAILCKQNCSKHPTSTDRNILNGVRSSTTDIDTSCSKHRRSFTLGKNQSSKLDETVNRTVSFSADPGFKPYVSILLSEYTVRMTKRGKYCLKITKNMATSTNATSTDVETKGTSVDSKSIKNREKSIKNLPVMKVEENQSNGIFTSHYTIRLKLSSRGDQIALAAAARGQRRRMEL